MSPLETSCTIHLCMEYREGIENPGSSVIFLSGVLAMRLQPKVANFLP